MLLVLVMLVGAGAELGIWQGLKRAELVDPDNGDPGTHDLWS